jgi:uncharacterized protein
MAETGTVQELYRQAVEDFLEKVRQDPYIVAVILVGSLSHDVVWQKSDIDVLLVTDEAASRGGKPGEKAFSLVERGINIHAYLSPRGEFRRLVEGSVQSSFFHSLVNHGRILFTRDESLHELIEGLHHLGARDRQHQLLRFALFVMPCLTKAEKWLRAKQDLEYCFLWIMRCLDGLAGVETVRRGEVAGREVILQAMRLNPEFFRPLYTDLIHAEKDYKLLDDCLRRIEGYLMEHLKEVFGPVLEYLAEAGVPRSATEINYHFKTQMNLEGADMACEWLADQEVIGKAALPVRLTPRSRVAMDEAAYFYETN